MLNWFRRRPRFTYAAFDRDLDLWKCGVCSRVVSQRQMVFHAASKHGFNAPNVRITNQSTARTRVVPL